MDRRLGRERQSGAAGMDPLLDREGCRFAEVGMDQRLGRERQSGAAGMVLVPGQEARCFVVAETADGVPVALDPEIPVRS